jgi:copper chaperone
MTTERNYTVRGMTCGHCESAVREEVSQLEGVERVDVDRATGRLTVAGAAVDDAEVKAAVEEAGYEVAA